MGRDPYTARPIFRNREGMGPASFYKVARDLFGDPTMAYELGAEFIRPQVPFAPFLQANPPSTNVYTAAPEETRSAAAQMNYDTPALRAALKRKKR